MKANPRYAAALALALALLTVAGLVAFWLTTRWAEVPLSDSPYLRDVVEPITMVDGISWDDGGSNGLAFRDSRQVVRYVCLLNDLDDVKNLALGSFVPSHKGIVPIAGIEERAFLGLLERWARNNPEVREWADRMDRYSRSEGRVSLFNDRDTDHDRANGFAVGILRRLRQRNW